MEKQLKKRWKTMCIEIESSGLKKNHIQSKIKTGPNSISLYTQSEDGEPRHPTYVTESVTAKLEAFFNGASNSKKD